VARLYEMERLLGQALLRGTRRERRKPLSRAQIYAAIIDGALEYLYDSSDPDARRIAAEIEATPEAALGEAVLDWARRLLAENPGGERVFRFLKNRAPHCLGRGYGVYRLYHRTRWVVEDWGQDYDYYRRAL